MKKLIAISVVFALFAAGAAFADTSIGAALELHWNIIQSNGTDTTLGGISVGESYIQFSSTNDDGTFGGILRTKFASLFEGGTAGTAGYNEIHNRAFIWWQPIPQIKLFLGQDGDGLFNSADLSRWGYHRGTRNVAVENWDAQDYLLGNWDTWSAIISLFPIDGLAIHTALALKKGVSSAIAFEDAADALQVQVVYDADGVGKFYLTWKGVGDDRIGLTFFSNSLVDGLSFEVGGNYIYDDAYTNDNKLFALIGAHYNADAWGVKTRIYLQPLDTFGFKVDIMPFFNLDFGTIFVNIRLLQNFGSTGDDIGWHVNPYIVLNAGPAQLRAGVLITDETGSGTTTWRVPLGMLYSF